ncbi:uncharacterized protein LOC131299936 [Rhododendron vialii]|uniref:uncharacterized protein LOC131299936 n=1 Tax=Rhododendron vialii TaxID=182163 RepID=UPI0026603B73|nr:uncharacterized protein LOC131299936 [Rhododendron vialii]
MTTMSKDAARSCFYFRALRSGDYAYDWYKIDDTIESGTHLSPALPRLPISSELSSCVSLGPTIYVFGGAKLSVDGMYVKGHLDELHWIDTLHPDESGWVKAPPTTRPRVLTYQANINGKIYVMGRGVTDVLENPELNCWRSLKPPLVETTPSGHAVLDGGKGFLMGKKSKKTNFKPLDLGNREAQNRGLQRRQVPLIDDVPEEDDFPPLEGGSASSSSSMHQQDSTFEEPEPGTTLYEEPKLEGTSIQYYKLGKLKDGVEVGITSLSRSIEESNATKINIVSFSNIEDMATQFWTLRYCAGEFVLKTHFVDEVASTMIVESFDDDINMWLNKTYKSYRREKKWSGDQVSLSWWTHLVKNGFHSIFRDILFGLREIYKHGYYHGRLLEGVAIKDNRAKLWNFRCAKPGKDVDRNEVMNDLSALRRMILQVLMRTSNFDLELEQQKEDVIAGHLGRLHIPEDIGNFLKVLNDETLLENVDLSWLVNDPAFWDEKKRRLWIADLWECINSSEKGTSSLFDTYLPIKHEKWRDTVVEGSCWHDVVKRIEADKNRYWEQNGGSEVDIDFHELTRFYRHSIEHYDRVRVTIEFQLFFVFPSSLI